MRTDDSEMIQERPERRAELRKEAGHAGIEETGRYVEWLETMVIELEQERDRAHGVIRVAGE